MKILFRLLGTGLALCLLLTALAPLGFASGDGTAARGEAVAPVATDGIVSDLTEFMNAAGMTTSSISNHGHGQTRICSVSSGTYYCLFTGEDSEADPLPWSLFRTNPDGTTEIVYSDLMPYHPGGPTTVVMADKNEDIWVYSGWRIDGTPPRFAYHAYHYDVDTGITTDYYSHVVYALPENRADGGGAGYSVACIDPERGEIYAVCNSGDVPGYMEWSVFDIETKEWSQPRGAVLDYRYCYDYLLPDGKGGFHCFGQRDIRSQAMITDLGISVYEAAYKYNTHWRVPGMLYDEWNYFHIPNAREAKIELQTPVEKVIYDVMNGMYGDSHTADAFMDAEGRLHFLCSMLENITPGWHTIHVVYDVSDGLKEITRQEIDFLAGANNPYSARMFQDSTGAFYVVACREEMYEAYLEIWRAETPTDELSLVWSEPFPYWQRFSNGSGTWDILHAANSRSNSNFSDQLKMCVYSSLHLQWYYFEVDFEALRAYISAVLDK